MEGSIDNHSDSDSGESWTLLEASSTPSPCPSPAVSVPGSAGDILDIIDKDEDTDGISIISDSESESIAAYEQAHRDDALPPEQSEEPPQASPEENTSFTPEPITATEPDEPTRYEVFLGDSTKLKTYVHRRNNKVSSVLNVIMLGSVITAAGVALGHIWGVKDDCTLQTTSSVNKILSNLYKLQEENAFLRSKLKELTLAGHIQMQKKATAKINKCRKVFEEPLQSANMVKTAKCMDTEADIPQDKIEFKKTALPLPISAIDESMFDSAVDETEFKNDVKKLSQIYKENRHWLDGEVAKRLKHEEARWQNPNKVKTLSKEKPKGERYEPTDINNNPVNKKDDNSNLSKQIDETKDINPIIVSYSESVKYGGLNQNSIEGDNKKGEKRDIKPNYPYNIVPRKTHILRRQDAVSEDDDIVTGDDRHSTKKYKYEKTKNDRQKPYRKHKRENKYEQWEMKGGYMRDYDSVTSFDSRDNVKPNYDNDHQSKKWDKNYNDKISDAEGQKNKESCLKGDSSVEYDRGKIPNGSSESKKIKGNKSADDAIPLNWFDKRSILRRQARQMLESEVPINNRKLLKSNARWYFRRMSDREQLRTRGSNSSEYKTQRRNAKNRR